MGVESYLQDPGWSELIVEPVCGRPTQVFKERPKDVLDLLTLTTAPRDFDFLVQGERRITYGAFLDGVDRAAEAMQELGVGAGDRVLVVLYNSIEFMLVQWAAWRLRAVPVLGNRWWSPRDIADVIGWIEPAAVVSDVEVDATALGGRPLVHPDEVAQWWARPESQLPPPPPVDEDDVVVMVFTAGSSGQPKGVQLSHRNLWWTQQTLHVMQRGRPAPPTSAQDQSVALMTTPMFHNGAVVAGMSALLDGNRIVLLPGRFDAGQALRLIQDERVTSWNAVPTMFSRVLAHEDFASYDLSALRSPSTGGAMVPPALIEAVSAQLPHVAQSFAVGYGMTEMSFLTIVPASMIPARPGTVGKPIPGVEMRVHEPDEHGEGELVGRSGAMMAGYFSSQDDPIDAEGWYHTGDLGRIDDDGLVYVTGRVKDMVIRGGENIACPRVEYALIEHDDVLEVAVFGVADHELGEALAAVVHLREGSAVTGEDLAAFARQRLAYFEVPTRWIISPTPLPVLPTGKLDKVGLRRALRTEAVDA